MDEKLNRTNGQHQTRGRSGKSRLAPALGLFFLAPLIGEFLLGNLPITWLWALLTLAPLYGGGALLIRETARRLKLGWPSIVLLGLVFAIIEEAFVTQSLFNPNFLGLRLLDYGYISSLGISAWWTVFVLGIHTVWSTSVPIALVESLTPTTRRTPWLGPVGWIVTAILFGIGCFLTAIFQQGEPFRASTMQFVTSGVVIVILLVIALLLGRAGRNDRSASRETPNEWIVGGTAFLLGSAFMSLAAIKWTGIIPASLNVAGMLILIGTGSLLFWSWSQRSGWSERHRLAVAGGLLLTYAWYGFVQIPSTGGTTDPQIDVIGNAVFAMSAVILLIIARKRASESAETYSPQDTRRIGEEEQRKQREQKIWS